MTVIISTKYSEKQFDNQFTIKIGSTPDCDFVVDNEKFSLTLQYFPSGNTYVATNNTNSGILFKGQNFSKVEITSITRFLFPNSDNYLNIKVLPANTNTKNTNSVNDVNMNNTDGITPKSKLDLAKSKIENIRVGIISEISQPVADLKKKISQNTKGAIFTHFALFWACFAIWCFCFIQWVQCTFIKKYKDTDKMLYWNIWILASCLGLNICNLFMKLTRVG